MLVLSTGHMSLSAIFLHWYVGLLPAFWALFGLDFCFELIICFFISSSLFSRPKLGSERFVFLFFQFYSGQNSELLDQNLLAQKFDRFWRLFFCRQILLGSIFRFLGHPSCLRFMHSLGYEMDFIVWATHLFLLWAGLYRFFFFLAMWVPQLLFNFWNPRLFFSHLFCGSHSCSFISFLPTEERERERETKLWGRGEQQRFCRRQWEAFSPRRRSGDSAGATYGRFVGE